MKKEKKEEKDKSKEKVDEIEEEFGELDINPIIFDYMIKKTFNMFDEDGSGDIDKSEFSKLTDVLGLQIESKKQAEIIRELDKEGSGTIDFDEFLTLMAKFQMGDVRKHLEGAFYNYDKDMDSIITVDDILKVSEELDEQKISKEDAELILAFFKYFVKKKASAKNPGINKDEFMHCLIKLNFLIEKDDNSNDLSNFVNKSKSGVIFDDTGKVNTIEGARTLMKSGNNKREYDVSDIFDQEGD